MTTKKKSTKSEGDDEVFLGTGAAGDPQDPAKRQSPDYPTIVVTPEITVPDHQDTVKTGDDK